jgi:hypothetical protein
LHACFAGKHPEVWCGLWCDIYAAAVVTNANPGSFAATPETLGSASAAAADRIFGSKIDSRTVAVHRQFEQHFFAARMAKRHDRTMTVSHRSSAPGLRDGMSRFKACFTNAIRSPVPLPATPVSSASEQQQDDDDDQDQFHGVPPFRALHSDAAAQGSAAMVLTDGLSILNAR